MKGIGSLFSMIKSFVMGFGGFLSWFSVSIKQTTASYVDLQTADSEFVLVANDGSLMSVIKIEGVTHLIGTEEFTQIQTGLQQSLQASMSLPGHSLQVFFGYNKDRVSDELTEILSPSADTAKRLNLDLDDLFSERVQFLSGYCAHESVYLVLWTKLDSMTAEQRKRASKQNLKNNRQDDMPAFMSTQNIIAAVPQLREGHDSLVNSLCHDLSNYGIVNEKMEVHDAIRHMRDIADPEFTSRDWSPSLPGDDYMLQDAAKDKGDISDLTWPSLAKQLLPRDGFVQDLRTAQMGDRIYSTLYIDLFPKSVQNFSRLLSRTLQTSMPWRISFMVDSDGLKSQWLRSAVSSVLAFTSQQNRLINKSLSLLNYISLNTDNAVVKLRVSLSTWAKEGDMDTLRVRTSLLAKAVEGWGSCQVSEKSGDPFAGMMSTQMGMSYANIAPASIAPLSDVLYMLPLFRPASQWRQGAVMLRTPDGKPWPYHPGSQQQTTWIDLFYARPGSGKSVLSNAINLAVCLSSGLMRLPRIAIIDIGPSSGGLISLLKDALPPEQKHLVAHHRLRMTEKHAINPFDTQLGCRFPTPQERSFLINFLCLLTTPVGSSKSYDGAADMAGLIVDELYKQFSDAVKPNVYAFGVEPVVDGLLDEIGYVADIHTSWWEVTDALFVSGFSVQAGLAQRHAMPVLAEVAAICRLPAIADLYGKITVTTGEPLLHAFSRLISSSVREYPIISQVTQFDLGNAKVVALDLDEVARSGGDAADRQTAVMYMLARYVLARDYYLTEDNVSDMSEAYRDYHEARILEIREDPKRIVFDEFHRTAKSQAVRDQVVLDMREGRKWKVQIALLSQSIDDFDSIMVEFATSVFIMDAGPEQAIQKTAKTFGLSETAQNALRQYVHGPGPGGATFLSLFSTKIGVNTQLLTSTMGPIELWALSTTAEDANIRNQLYKLVGPRRARQLLAARYPSGSAVRDLEERYASYKDSHGLIDQNSRQGVVQQLIDSLVSASHNRD